MIKPLKKLTMIKKETAQTMVEFAIVFPIILLITYGIIEFGRMVFMYAAATGGAREGARYGATALNYKNCDGIWKATTRLLFLIPKEDIIVGDIGYDDGPPTSSSTPPLCSSDHITYVGPKELTLGDRVVVHIEVSYQPLIGSFLGVTGFTIVGEDARTILVDIKMITPYP